MINFGLRKKLTFKKFINLLKSVLHDNKKRHNMIKVGSKICSGRGKHIVYKYMLQKL